MVINYRLETIRNTAIFLNRFEKLPARGAQGGRDKPEQGIPFLAFASVVRHPTSDIRRPPYLTKSKTYIVNRIFLCYSFPTISCQVFFTVYKNF